MAFEEDDHVTLHDEHSEFDGETGTVTQIMETMFGDATYTVEFAEGREQGVPEDALEAAPEAEDEPEDEDAEPTDESDA
ncbi:DUF1918 domain-containing protein [Halorhabdus sp. CBA1104]|uniref:DUF1918 domain-containing protein n=1 Tax=unclassified Halorhabdus TaxID=2621901 RepID=UPI0012B24C36|nr:MULTISPECIES: DUF1918 domain-containing protein [unclassified Halorhabdus]QGN07092.1 DUF1918 domain-containing protein [Halorhabdus sp. CBA1104]